MTLPDIKALKKLASACRSAGIKHFKGVDFEFTLSEEPPVIRKRLRKTIRSEDPSSPIADDYSSGPTGTEIYRDELASVHAAHGGQIPS